MKTDLSVLDSLKTSLPPNKILIAESGIQTVHDLERVRCADAVLIGSMFLNAEDLETQLSAAVEASRRATT